eukprot:COSAG05_NODE_702_length_7857_cov_37.135244_8_plen_100_part_00
MGKEYNDKSHAVGAVLKAFRRNHGSKATLSMYHKILLLRYLESYTTELFGRLKETRRLANLQRVNITSRFVHDNVFVHPTCMRPYAPQSCLVVMLRLLS